MKNPYKISLFCLVISLFLPCWASATTLNNYFEYFYNRYSQHFDTNGLKYAIPDYGVKKMTYPTTPREIISLASYYKFRALKDDSTAQVVTREELLASLSALEKQTHFSFNDGEALYLSYTLDKQLPNLLSFEEKIRLKQTIVNILETGLLAKDTENRAIISATHFQILINELFKENLIEEKNKIKLDQLAKEKIDLAIKQTISKDGWYRENNLFSPHYQAVSAYMILLYSESTNNSDYYTLAKKMYFNLKALSFNNGLIEAKIGNRPVGLGAQFYLMMGIMGLSFQDKEAAAFLAFAQSNTFFQDKKYPNRLEYHCTSCSYHLNFHDDYAFSDIAELSSNLIDPETSINLNLTRISPINVNDSDFKISHQNQIIIIKDKKTKSNLTVKQLTNRKSYLKKYFY